MSLIKAFFLGAILTFVVSETIHAADSSGGYLKITEFHVSGHFMHWSWPLFIVATGLAWGILLLMK
jgi:hypothetical protein